MGLKRKKGLQKAPNKVCLNLFFDESNLVVLESKKTEFVAHEVLQMKPIINKGNAYERFLKANEWVFMLFPNAKSKVKNQKSKFKFKSEKCFKNFKLLTLTSNFIESIFKKAQLFMINRHRTTEIVTSTQLWFHPVDFGNKI